MNAHTACALVSALFLASNVFAHTVALRMLLLAAGLVLASVAAYRDRRSIRALPPIWLAFVLWGAWAALSLAWSLEPDRTVKEWRNEVLYAAAGLWICYVGAQARQATRIFACVAAAAATLACAIALYEFSQGQLRYLQGWHGGPGDHSSALLTLMPCVAMAGWYAFRAGWPRRALLAVGSLALLMAASAYTTLSRTLWLALAAEFVVLGSLLLARIPGALHNPRVRIAAGTLVLAAVAGCTAVLVSIQAERAVLGATVLEEDHRFALWPEIASRIAARPLTGYGFGRGVLREELQQKFGALDENLWHAHNLFLEALVQLGVPGLALLLVLLGALLREGWRAARHPDEASAACGMALVGVVAGMLVRNMTDMLLVRQNALLFWAVAGVLLALSARPWRA